MIRTRPILLWAIVGAALIGFTDAAYLAAEHYFGGIPTCYVGSGCETVLTSQYATLFGIPVSLFGAIYYLATFFLGLQLVTKPNRSMERALMALVSLGMLATLGLVYLQLVILNAICFYCMVSAGTTTVLFALMLGITVFASKSD